MATFDDLRAAFPWGWAVYAYEPGGPVTIEAHTEDGQTMTMACSTLQECLDALMPPPPQPEPVKALGLLD